MIKKMAVAKIIMPDTHDTDGYPIKGGLMDPRMGVIDPGLRCRTCKSKMGDCPGHFGYIELARPVVHIGYAKMIYNIIRSICGECCRIMLIPEKINKYNDKLENAISQEEFENIIKEIFVESRKPKRCPYCGTDKPKIKLEKPTTIMEGTTKNYAN